MFISISSWFKCHSSSLAKANILNSPDISSPPLPTVPVSSSSTGAAVPQESNVEGKEQVVPSLPWYRRCGRGIKKCCGLDSDRVVRKCPCGFGCKKTVVKGQGQEKLSTDKVIESNTNTEDPFVDTSSSSSKKNKEEEEDVVVAIPGGGAELTRTQTIHERDGNAVGHVIDEPPKTSFFEKCKNVLAVGGIGGSGKGEQVN